MTSISARCFRRRISSWRRHFACANRVIVFAALLFASFGMFGGFMHANEVEVPRQQFRNEEELKKYREAAVGHFHKRCRENAGEKIYRTVPNVQGAFLERPRTGPTDSSLRDQYWMGDPYGLVLYPPAEISRYLNYLDEKGIPTKRKTARLGFQYVVIQRSRGEYIQYRLQAGSDELLTTVLGAQPSRYSVTWQDISTEEDRKYWVAGGRLQVIELETRHVLGERIGYVFESGFGSTAGGRVPWLIARRNACPPIERNVAKDRLFVEKVLRPSKDESNGK